MPAVAGSSRAKRAWRQRPPEVAREAPAERDEHHGRRDPHGRDPARRPARGTSRPTARGRSAGRRPPARAAPSRRDAQPAASAPGRGRPACTIGVFARRRRGMGPVSSDATRRGSRKPASGRDSEQRRLARTVLGRRLVPRCRRGRRRLAVESKRSAYESSRARASPAACSIATALGRRSVGAASVQLLVARHEVRAVPRSQSKKTSSHRAAQEQA